MLTERSIQRRLESLWNGLPQEEQLVLSEVQKLQGRLGRNSRGEKTDRLRALDKNFQGLAQQHGEDLRRLKAKGFCQRSGTGWYLGGDLLATYVANVEGRGSGRIWLDDETGLLYFGKTP